MKKLLLAFLLFLSLSYSSAQNAEVLVIKNDSSEIILEAIDIQVEVIGNIAMTTTEMVFYNPNDRVLEGELNFPLAEGQRVIRFAMDVNGKLREGVAVEKSLGRKAFEGVVRQQIDPGLLELTAGNNYKARVYPIPAKGRKRVVVGYEEELKSFYQLVLKYGRVDQFSLKVEVVNQMLEPAIRKNELANFTFKKWRSSFLAEHKEYNFQANGVFNFEIPAQVEQKVFRQYTKKHDFFYLITNPEIVKYSKELPEALGILWDASQSGSQRNIKKELALLESYLGHFSKVKVRVIKFSNEITGQADFTVSKGDTRKLLNYLENTVYDGGTDLNMLKLDEQEPEEWLLFSDGIYNLREYAYDTPGKTLHTITSGSINNADYLKYLARNTGGRFINLLNSTLPEATDLLLNLNYQFLYAEYDPKVIEEVYPSQPTPIKAHSTFTVSGQLKTKKSADILLHFGTPGRVLKSERVTITKENNSASLARLWAGKKVAELMQLPDAKRDEIIKVGKEYGLVTPYTSLIVLDRVEDYVEYQIEPPVELRKEYVRLLNVRKTDKAAEQADIVEWVLEDYEDRIEWWDENLKNLKPTPAEDQISVQEVNALPEPDTSQDNSSGEGADVILEVNPNRIQSPSEVDTTVFNRVIEGVIYSEEDGLPLPGVNVMIKGTTIGTVTDINGEYTIRVRENDVLVFSFIGFATKEINSHSNTKIDVNLQADVKQLSEVVVSALRAESDSRALSYLQGQATGVQVGNTGQNKVIIRGATSINTKCSTLLFVVDGEIASASELQALPQEDIVSISMIKGSAATTLYGAKAAKGVVVVSTKATGKTELELPDSEISRIYPPVEFKEWEPDAPYVDSLKNTLQKERYSAYLALREQHGKTPSFYLAASDLLLRAGEEEKGLRVLSNIAELELENHELLKILAHKYRQVGQLKTSIYFFKKIVELRNDEPQSKRDLALAYQANGEYQKALDLFLEIILQEWDYDIEDRFPLIKSTVIYEMNNLIYLHKKKLDLSEVPKALIKKMPVDVRIVLSWNSLETDMDLWVTEPNGEKCYYSNPLTKIGGRLTEDYMDGYGPEEYLLKNAIPGEYKIEVEYFDERVQKIAGPVTLKVTVFTNYGSKDQTSREMILQLEDAEDVVEVGTITFSD